LTPRGGLPHERSGWVRGENARTRWPDHSGTAAIRQAQAVIDGRHHRRTTARLSAEGPDVASGVLGLAGRLRAIRDTNGDAALFHLIAQPVDLLYPYGELTAVRDAARHIGAKLIVLDTLNRMTVGGDENGPEDMGKFIANVATLRCDTGAHVAAVHHGTKNLNGSTPLGHSSRFGTADLVVEIAKPEAGSRSATTVTAAKDDPDGAAMGFRLRVVELGTDQEASPATQPAAPRAHGAAWAKPSSRRLQRISLSTAPTWSRERKREKDPAAYLGTIARLMPKMLQGGDDGGPLAVTFRWARREDPSSRCQVSPGCGGRRRSLPAKSAPNFRHQCRMLLWVTKMPRSARISSTSRRLTLKTW
jgi:hypothetical protein